MKELDQYIDNYYPDQKDNYSREQVRRMLLGLKVLAPKLPRGKTILAFRALQMACEESPKLRGKTNIYEVARQYYPKHLKIEDFKVLKNMKIKDLVAILLSNKEQ